MSTVDNAGTTATPLIVDPDNVSVNGDVTVSGVGKFGANAVI